MKKNEWVCDGAAVHEDVVREVGSQMCADDMIAQASDFFRIFGDPTRLKMIWALHKHELCVCDLASVLGMTKSAVSHQLSLLRGAKLVKFRRDGKTVYYALADDHIEKILETGLAHIQEKEV